jgi:hypothetical protein
MSGFRDSVSFMPVKNPCKLPKTVTVKNGLKLFYMAYPISVYTVIRHIYYYYTTHDPNKNRY